MVDSDFGLCGTCWRDTPFIGGTVCDACGVPLQGESDGTRIECDECMAAPRPWSQGRAALIYRDAARRIVLRLKHGDQSEVAQPAAKWLAQAGRSFLTSRTLIAPVPLHWSRLLKRKYNQSALLSGALGAETGLAQCPDLLVRRRKTESQEGKNSDQRFANLDGAIAVHPRRRHRIAGRPVVIVDDVMTSGATFAACAQACLEAGAADVSVLALARVAKDA